MLRVRLLSIPVLVSTIQGCVKTLTGIPPLAPGRREQYQGDLHFDLGNMMACEQGPIDRERFQREPDAACLELANQITQSLVAQLFQLPSEAAPVRPPCCSAWLRARLHRSYVQHVRCHSSHAAVHVRPRRMGCSAGICLSVQMWWKGVAGNWSVHGSPQMLHIAQLQGVRPWDRCMRGLLLAWGSCLTVCSPDPGGPRRAPAAAQHAAAARQAAAQAARADQVGGLCAAQGHCEAQARQGGDLVTPTRL